MMSFTAGIILGGIVGVSLGLVIATLAIGSGRASEDDRVRESYRAGIIAGRDRP
jgi:hypothetical protein